MKRKRFNFIIAPLNVLSFSILIYILSAIIECIRMEIFKVLHVKTSIQGMAKRVERYKEGVYLCMKRFLVG